VLYFSQSGFYYFGYRNFLSGSGPFLKPLHRAMLNDKPERREFKLKRFLKNGKLDSSVGDPMDIAFGFDRRRNIKSNFCFIHRTFHCST
jgi:hypothetical protein